MPAIRIALAAVALLACAWFALGIRQSNDLNRATALLATGSVPSQATTAQIMHLLDGAATLNPDRLVDILRAQAQERSHRYLPAQRLMERVVHDEPNDINAWIVLAIAAYGRGDLATSNLALRREAELAPPVRPAS